MVQHQHELLLVVVLVLVMLVEVVGVDADDPSQTRRRICNITVIASGVRGISRCCLMNDEIVCWLSNLFFRPPSFPNSPALLAFAIAKGTTRPGDYG